MQNINLAYKLEDGMKIYIPTKQEIINQNDTKSNNINLTINEDLTQKYVTSSSDLSDNKNNKENNTSKININSATQAQLETLPGIGSATATKIIEYRSKNGKFKKIEDIKEVSGIGDAKFEKIKELITTN